MHRNNWHDLPAHELKLPGAERATVRLLVGGDVAPNFVMLMIELDPGGHTPGHHHEWEEEIFVLSGPGKLESNGEEIDLREGDALLLGPDQPHQFSAPGPGPLRILCVIPKRS